jgi:hypothetical protein
MATVQTTTYNSTTDTSALTITLASLPTSSTLLVGRESTAISNASDLYLDALVSGQIMTGTSPSAGQIEVWVYSYAKIVSSTVTYNNPCTGSDAAITLTAETKLRMYLADVMTTNSSSNIAYGIKPFGVAQFFGNILPARWGIIVTHSTAVNLHATSSNHYIHYQGIKYTST